MYNFYLGNRFYEKSSKENRASLKKHRLLKKEYELKESALLADPKQVKKLVELILLDLDVSIDIKISGEYSEIFYKR